MMALNRVMLVSFFLCFWFLIHSSNANVLKICKFDAIYQLGDSITDTGNFIRENPSFLCSRHPFGGNYFNHSTGRCSNGLVMSDYFALSAGVPLLDAYLNPKATFNGNRGANFAVAGATALPIDVLTQRWNVSSTTNNSLSIQLDWMSTYFKRISSNEKEYERKHKSALFIVGEIGGNDYNYAFFKGKTIEEVTPMVSYVVQAIKDAVKKIIGFGGRKIIVPGNFPIGCIPFYLTRFQNNDKSHYDELKCLKSYNNFSIYHNEKLQQAIRELEQEYPNVTIVYGDYYNSYIWILRNAAKLGFDRNSSLKACCGSGGEYNFGVLCGNPGVGVCSNPKKYISWDGIHATHQTYFFMAKWLTSHILPQLHCFQD